MPKDPHTNSTARPPWVPPPAEPAPAHSVPLTDLERLRLDNVLLRTALAQSQLTAAQMQVQHAEAAAIACVRELLLGHGQDPERVREWQVDTQQGRLVRTSGMPGDAGG
jgi:hypothetical protein